MPMAIVIILLLSILDEAIVDIPSNLSSVSVDDEPALDGDCANRMLFIAYYAQCTNKRSPTVPDVARVKSSMQGPLVVDPSWRPESPMR